MISKEQAEEIKKQLIEQVEKNFPDDKKQITISQIVSMNEEELEDFLKKNNLETSNENQKCIFCSIVDSEIPSYKLDEDKNAVAVLELNPISNAHTIILPKKHLSPENIPEEIKKFAQKISKKIKTKFKPKKIEIIFSELFGHGMINLLPIYNEEKISSPRRKASEKELEENLKKFKEEKSREKKPKIKKPEKEIIKEKEQEIKSSEESKLKKISWLPLRIP